MEQRIVDLVAEVLQLSPDAVHEDLTMQDVPEWDSLRHVELITGLESEFGIDLGWEDIVAMQSIGAIHDVVRAKTGQAGDAAAG